MNAGDAARVKCASQADPPMLDELKARAEGRLLQALVGEAFQDYVEKNAAARCDPWSRWRWNARFASKHPHCAPINPGPAV